MEIKTHYAYFSAAMKAGIEMLPAIHGPYVERVARDGQLEACGTCAIGAGMVAMGLDETAADVYAVFPYMRTRTRCPKDGCTGHLAFSSLLDVAITLFEEHGWTREAVADWLYAEEEKLGFVSLIESDTSAAEMTLETPNLALNCQASIAEVGL